MNSELNAQAAISARSVLLVDDNPFELAIIGELFEHAGFNVTSALDGAKALEFFEKNEFDLIMMDCEMPFMQGSEVVQIIRQKCSDITDQVFIIGMSSCTNKNYEKEMLESGADYFLAKPFNHGQLMEVVEAIIK